MAEGKLVSDDIVNQLVRERTRDLTGYILDGYPRTLPQAKSLDEMLAGRKYPRAVVINLDVPAEEIVKRLSARGRADDKPEVIRQRLQVYARDTQPLIDYYRSGAYHHIDGSGSIDEVYARVRTAILSRLRPR
jgi:adenylate kinase